MITGLIITFNEEANIERTLASLKWLDNIVIIDSFSTDKTIEIVKSFNNTTVYQRKFTDFADQCNFGLTKCKTDWIISIDADYFFPDDLKNEIQNLLHVIEKSEFVAFAIPFKYCIEGIPLKGNILPPRKIIMNKSKCNYFQDGHAHKLECNGESSFLKNPVYHDDRKSLKRWLDSQNRYADKEHQKLKSTKNRKNVSFADKLRYRKYFAPLLIFLYCYFFKLGFLDGKRGFYYAYQRMYAELLLSLKLIDFELKKTKNE